MDDSRFDPPLPRHSDKTICPVDECTHGECHQGHREAGEFPGFCQACIDEKCLLCKGVGYVYVTVDGVKSDEEMDCFKCDSSGQVEL